MSGHFKKIRLPLKLQIIEPNKKNELHYLFIYL